MVCKEDVLLWFKDLEGYKRIDVMNELINMCVPFEIRFLGSCIEEIGKHSYQELRGPAITANDVDRLSKDSSLSNGLLDETTRHRVLIYLSLLSSRNCKCANWFYKKMLRTESLESYIVNGNCKDENVLSELLLLYTMGLYHPAFSFEQKTFFGSMLAHLIEQKEGKKRISPKPFGGYPPGFGYPSPKISQHQHEIPQIPVKTASPMCHGDSTTLHQHHPPCLPAQPTMGAPLEFVQMWTRPAPFPGTISGAPDVAPFPPQPISPIVSQPASPTPSRAASPHRTFPMRSTPGLQPPTAPPPIEILTQLPLDPLSQTTTLATFNPDLKSTDDELNHIQDDKLRDGNSWAQPVVVPVDMKPPNGIRFPPYKVPQQQQQQQQYLFEQMQALSLEGENSLHRSSSSSSTSSLNQSPPDTPTITPSGTPHGGGPGRGGGGAASTATTAEGSAAGKARVNGIPPFAAAGLPLCDTTCPPPPVPYSNYLPHGSSLAGIPNRTIFQYTQSFRPPFSGPFTAYQPAENVIYSSYSGPYVPVMFPSAVAAVASAAAAAAQQQQQQQQQQPPPPPAPPRNPNCYNCGASGHSGAECASQTIEEITQKKAFTLEFGSPLLPDTDK